MARGGYLPDWQRALIALSASVIFTLVVVALYWARSICIPIALAIFMSFVLSPVVHRLQRVGLNRIVSVVLTVTLAVVLAAGTGALIAQQFAGLANELSEPERAQQIKDKVADVRERLIGGGESRLGKLVEDVSGILFPKPRDTRAKDTQAASAAVLGGAATAVTPPPSPNATGIPGVRQPMAVVIESEGSTWWAWLESNITPATEFLGQVAFAFVLTVFMLLKKEDLRNRMIRLTGHGKVTTTTKAVDDASKRISKYLLAQLMLNAAFGVVIAAGLLMIGVAYPLLWGFVAFLMRYIPYIGSWIGAIMPAVFAFAMYPDLWVTITVVGLFAGLELICNNVFEPWLYGASMGMSEVAQLVAAGLWAFLWGPIGLILSGPLSVCLLVLGKYVSRFRFLEILLGDEPVLEPRVAFYQRLTAHDQDEASDIALKVVKDEDPAAVYDRVIVPALCLAKRDQADGDLSGDDVRFVVRASREIAEEVAAEKPIEVGTVVEKRARLLLCPSRDEIDHVGIDLLAHLLDPTRWEVEVTADEILASELLLKIEAFQPAAVVVGSLPPGGMAHTRYIVARIRAKYPALKVIIGRWGRGDDFTDESDTSGAGADWVDTALGETRKRLTEWYAVFTAAGDETSTATRNGKSGPVGTPAATVG